MRLMPLKRVARIIAGQSPPSHLVSDFDDGQRPFLQGNAEFGAIHPVPRWQCDAAPKRAEPGDILLSVRAPVGALNWADRHYGIGRGLCAIRAEGELEPRFAWWMAQGTTPRLAAVSTGSTYDAVTADDVKNLRVPVPVWETQIAIADFLDAETERIDALIAAGIRRAQLFAERRGAVMFAAVSGALTYAGARRQSTVPWLSTLPDSWSEVKLTHVARLGSGHTPSRSKPQWWQDCTIPWITTGEVAQVRDDRREVLLETREMISAAGLANSSAELRPAGTVVLCRTAASAGYSAVMGTEMATSQDFVTWTCGDQLLPRFLLFCLRSMRADLLGRLAMGSTHKTIYFPDIESIRIPLPSFAEQQEALEMADRQLQPLGPLEVAVGRQIALLRERRQALITAAVAGDLQVPSAAAATTAA